MTSKHQPCCFSFLLAALVYSFWATPATAGALWTATLEECTQATPIDCDTQLRVEIELTFESTAHLDDIVIDQALMNGQPHVFDVPVHIRVGQAEPWVLYPLTARHQANFYPGEEVIRVQNPALGVQGCVDDPLSPYPTCGWAYDDNGDPIPHSQGFCCNKDMDALLSGEVWRGEEVLGDISTIQDNFSTAHCYRPGELRFLGSEIEHVESPYEIHVDVGVSGAMETFSLAVPTPAYLAVADNPAPQLNLFAEFLPDPKEASPASLGNYFLYGPAAPAEHPWVIDPEMHTMLVPREQLTLTGNDCDLVGTDYAGFSLQSAYCATSRAGDCLQNQLFHKHASDEAKLQADPEAWTDYLVRGTAFFRDTDWSVTEAHLRYTVEPHVVTLSIDASGLFYIHEIVDLAARPKRSKVQLTWSPTEDTDCYNVYRGETAGGPYAVIASCHQTEYATYADTDVQPDVTYYYTVAPVAGQLVVGESNEAVATPIARSRQ